MCNTIQGVLLRFLIQSLTEWSFEDLVCEIQSQGAELLKSVPHSFSLISLVGNVDIHIMVVR